MGLLDQLIGAATSSFGNAGQADAGQTNAPAGTGDYGATTTTNYNAGQTQAAAPQAPSSASALSGIVDLLHSPQVGGIGGLLQLFQSHGLGHVAQGWVGQGPNPGVSSNQLMQVLGPAVIGQFASRLGLPQDQASHYLSQLLPHVVDHMTPDGQVPPETATPSNAGGIFDMLKGRLLGG